nr:reverse transcriptase domain-containing protein [Tanacetum cinerariifolium]
MDVKGAPECMKISGFMHGITNPKLIKRLHDKIPKSVDEMMRVTTSFLKSVVAASSRERKKSFSLWKQQEDGHKQNFKKGGFRNQQRSERKQDRYIFPPLREEDGTEGPMIIKAEMGGHFLHRMYVNGGSFSEILKAGSKENPGSSIYSSRNAKIPSNMRNGYITEQQDYSTRVHNGYKVNAAELKVCPDKVEAVLSLPSPKCLKDVQRLNGKLASLNRLLSKSVEKSLLFFKTLKKCTKKSDFQWTAKAETAFKQMKKLIAELPMLTAPKEKEELIIYLAAAKEAINAVLMTERDEKQVPIYFVRHALQGSKINYTAMEKLILALVSASKRLKRYFQAHTIIVITGQQIKQILSNPEIKGRLLKWSFKLKEHDIHYRQRTRIIMHRWLWRRPNTYESRRNGIHICLRFRFDVTNNEAEYKALMADLRIAERIDALSKMASTSFAHLSKQVLIEELKEKSIVEKEVLAVVEEERRTWMTLSHEYPTKEIIPEEKRKARAIRHKAGRYAVTNGILYKKSFLRPWLRCVGPLQENYVLREIHDGSCSMHAGPRSVVAKTLRSGYYWPTMHADARKLIGECNSCQIHHPELMNRQQNLTLITSPLPFYKWGIDIAGPLSEGPGKVKFLILAIDYFTKWIEAKPIAAIIGAQIKKFVWDNIVCRKGKQGLRGRNQGAVRRKKQKLDGRDFTCLMGTPYYDQINQRRNTILTYVLEINLDLLEERREQAAIQETKSKAKMEKYYNARVCNTSFKPRDLVYQNNEARYAKDGGKLGPKWKGLYEVTKALGKGAYKLRDRNGNILP